jgi:hypothetical protein
VPYAAISEVRRAIKGLHKVRGDGWFSKSDQERYDVLCPEEQVLLADLRSQGLRVPAS